MREPTLKAIESIKWYLWHGNTYEALQHLETLEMELDAAVDAENKEVPTRKLLRAVEEFHTYITNNQSFITNYGERYRQGDRISTGFVESAVNYVSQAFYKTATNAMSAFTLVDANTGTQRRIGTNISTVASKLSSRE